MEGSIPTAEISNECTVRKQVPFRAMSLQEGW
jgi:hypothetical protein